MMNMYTLRQRRTQKNVSRSQKNKTRNLLIIEDTQDTMIFESTIMEFCVTNSLETIA